MAEAFFSPYWYRVANLRPALQPHANIHPHDYRGERWYVLEDRLLGRSHRFNPAARALISRMNAKRTLQEVWELAVAELGPAAPSQDDVIWLLGTLYRANLLLCDVPVDAREVLRRQRAEARRRYGRFLNPLFVRLPVFDPDPFLQRLVPRARPLFGRTALFLWLTVVGFAALLALKNAPEIVAHADEEALGPRNLLLLWLLYPVVKGLHELGHALATRVWGGEVHEMGIMFLLFTPVPYVDASAASVFPERHRRAAVAAMGIAVELFLAAVALFVWIGAEPGLLRNVALDVMLIGGVSTVLFNGNPLLRFDGYYVLTDILGIPGLAPRSLRYYGYLAQRHLFGLRETPLPALSPGERPWLLVYGAASFAYRMAVVLVIIVYLAGKYFVLGAALAIWAGVALIVWPLAKAARFVFGSPALHGRRRRAILVALVLGCGLPLLLAVVPVRLSTHAEGVVWLPDQALVRAAADGFVEELLAADGRRVDPGEPLVRIVDPDVELELAALEAEKREHEIRYYGLRDEDLAEAEIAREELRAVEARLTRQRERAGEQVLRAGASGTLVIPEAQNLVGRFVRQGEAVGYIVDWEELTARVVLPQSDIGAVRRGTTAVALRSADRPWRKVNVRILRELPGAIDRLPSRALGTEGGGSIQVDRLDASGLRTREKVFQLDLALPGEAGLAHVGTTVHVRFDHGYEPLALRWGRSLRRQLLRKSAE